MISRSNTRPSVNSSRQTVIASKVSELSHKARIIVSRPASIRFAIAISPSRDRSSTLPISRRYIRTGSSVRSEPSLVLVVTVVPAAFLASAVFCLFSSSSSSTSSASTMLIPMPESLAITSSICSEVNSSDGKTEFISS